MKLKVPSAYTTVKPSAEFNLAENIVQEDPSLTLVRIWFEDRKPVPKPTRAVAKGAKLKRDPLSCIAKASQEILALLVEAGTLIPGSDESETGILWFIKREAAMEIKVSLESGEQAVVIPER